MNLDLGNGGNNYCPNSSAIVSLKIIGFEMNSTIPDAPASPTTDRLQTLSIIAEALTPLLVYSTPTKNCSSDFAASLKSIVPVVDVAELPENNSHLGNALQVQSQLKGEE
jgi:hypothetical protein